MIEVAPGIIMDKMSEEELSVLYPDGDYPIDYRRRLIDIIPETISASETTSNHVIETDVPIGSIVIDEIDDLRPETNIDTPTGSIVIDEVDDLHTETNFSTTLPSTMMTNPVITEPVVSTIPIPDTGLRPETTFSITLPPTMITNPVITEPVSTIPIPDTDPMLYSNVFMNTLIPGYFFPPVSVVPPNWISNSPMISNVTSSSIIQNQNHSIPGCMFPSLPFPSITAGCMFPSIPFPSITVPITPVPIIPDPDSTPDDPIGNYFLSNDHDCPTPVPIAPAPVPVPITPVNPDLTNQWSAIHRCVGLLGIVSPEHSIPRFEQRIHRCPYCQALLFKKELTKSRHGKFGRCCGNGNIQLPEIPPVTEELNRIFRQPTYRECRGN